MKIVIDIPEETYQEFRIHGLSLCPRDEQELINAIRNGISLPKGHGRLKDVDWIENNCIYCYANDDESQAYRWEDINAAPTIIKADKEGK